MLQIIRAKDFTALSRHFFASLVDTALPDPLAADCLVVPNRIVAAWLRHERALNADGGTLWPHWDLYLLHVFVNDCLAGVTPGSERAPEAHPYYVRNLAWRIYRLLTQGDRLPSALASYLGKKCEPWRRFEIASALARCFDNYQVYRPSLLQRWEREADPHSAHDKTLWQAAIWQRLIRENAETYARAFAEMEKGIKASKVSEKYRRIAVFASPAMPPLYLRFFQILGESTDIHLYFEMPFASVLTPVSPGTGSADGAQLEGHAWKEPKRRNPLVAALGRLYDAFDAEIAYRRLSVHEIPTATAAKTCTALEALQDDIKNDRPLANEPYVVDGADDSIRIHICHNPLREVQVLSDHLRRWFSEDPSLEPRHVQVLVTDIALYAPLLQAVLGAPQEKADDIPFAIADRYVISASGMAQALVKLLKAARGRFKASEIIDLLGCEAIRQNFAMSSDDVDRLSALIKEGGIRWGLDAEQRRDAIGASFSAATTWRCGLDRLLLGYAMPSDNRQKEWRALDGEDEPLVAAGALREDDAATVGKLSHFLARLADLRQEIAGRQATLAEWGEILNRTITAFFAEHSANFDDIQTLRSLVADWQANAQAAGIADLSMEDEALICFIESEMGSAETADDLTANRVICSALRQGAALPRPIICILGLGDSLFPRSDNAPSFDLLRATKDKRAGDPSLRMADRAAFLEAIMAAQQRLYLSYVGRGERDESIIPPSPLVEEIKDWIDQRCRAPQLEDGAARTRRAAEFFEVVHHLQPFHPEYFRKVGRLFSCQSWALHACQSLLQCRQKDAQAPASPFRRKRGRRIQETAPASAVWRLDDIARFLANPSRHYFNGLGVFFPEDGVEEIEDDEPFATGYLDAYHVKDAIIPMLVKGEKPDDKVLYHALAQRCLIPLHEPGRAALQLLISECEDLLDDVVEAKKLREILALAIKNQKIDIALTHGRIRDEIALREVDGELWHVHFRPAKIKIKDYLSAWLVHAAAAAAQMRVCTYVLGEEAKEGCRYRDIQPEVGQRWLKESLAMMAEGRKRPLPFALATSYAFAEKLVAGGDDLEAKAEATETWQGGKSDKDRGECQDPYLRHAFGDDGPMVESDFAQYAEKVFGDLLRALPEGRKCARATNAAAARESADTAKGKAKERRRSNGKR